MPWPSQMRSACAAFEGDGTGGAAKAATAAMVKGAAKSDGGMNLAASHGLLHAL